MGMPLSRLPDPDSELPPPIPLPDDPSGHRITDRDGWPGLAYITVAATALTAGGYGASYVAESSPLLMTAMLTGGPSAVLGFTVWLVRKGVANPWIRKYERWRSRAQDWRDQALDAAVEIDQLGARVNALEDLLDQTAHYVTGVNDPEVARRRLNERLERQRAGNVGGDRHVRQTACHMMKPSISLGRSANGTATA